MLLSLRGRVVYRTIPKQMPILMEPLVSDVFVVDGLPLVFVIPDEIDRLGEVL